MKQIHPIEFGISSLEGVMNTLLQLGYPYSSVFVIADAGIPENVRQEFLGDTDRQNILVLPGGELVKTVTSIETIWQFLLKVQADRKALVVNLGGGAVCDAGGFAASTFKRGIDFVHVPSTLLSMVDASVGGKTGINVGGIKNTVGTFTMPQAVFIHKPLLDSLPQREMLSGYAEMIKHGLVADKSHLENVLREFSTSRIPAENTIRDSIAIKAAIVERDPLEQGERKLLNFGHTIGHGLESYLSEIPGSEVLHGEAVAAGMLAELFISVRVTCKGGFPENDRIVLLEALSRLAQHVKIDRTMLAGILKKIENDKKNEGDQIGVTVLENLGKGVWGTQVSRDLIKDSLQYVLESSTNYHN